MDPITDDTLEQETPAAAPIPQVPITPSPAAAAPRNEYDDLLAARNVGQAQQLRQAVVTADSTTPDRAAKVRGYAQQLGLPDDLVERNFDDISRRVKYDATPVDAIVQDTPHTATFLAQPANAAIAADDHQAIGALEWLVTTPSRVLAQTINENRYGALSAKRILGTLTQEEQDQLASYRYYAGEGARLGVGNSWFRGLLTKSMQTVATLTQPQAFETALGAVVGGVIGGGAAAFAGPEAIPVGAAAGARFGAGVGYTVGLAKSAFLTSAGAAYDNYLNMRDEFGQPMDPAVAKGAAILEGAANAGLMVLGGKVVGKGLEKAGAKLATRTVIEQALRQPSTRAAIADAVKSYGTTLTEGTAIVVAQRLAGIMASEFAKATGKEGKVAGQVERGNVDLFKQPKVQNADGTVSTVDSVSINIDGKEILIPRVTPDGRHLTTEEATAEYQKTGRNLGTFDSPAAADAFAQQLHEDYAAGKFERPSKYLTPAEIAEQLGRAAVEGVEGFALVGAAGPALGFYADIARAKRAEVGPAFFAALGEGVAQSKTGQRMPAALEQFLAQATKDGPLEHVYAPLEFWNTYWQDQGVDPREMATAVTGSPDAYEHATQHGGDLEIPTARYATQLAATDHNARFADELRLGPDAMNAREAREFADQVRSAPVPEPAAVSPTRKGILEQFDRAGVPASTAASLADAYEGVVGQLADRAGIENPYNVTISRPDLEAVPRAGKEPPATAVFLGHGPDGPLYNVIGGPKDRSTVSAAGLADLGIDVPTTPEATGERLSGEELRRRAMEARAAEPLPAGTQSRLRAAGVPEEEIGRLTVDQAAERLAERRAAAGTGPEGVERRAPVNPDEPIGLRPGFSTADVHAAVAAMRAENPDIDKLGAALRARAEAFDKTRKDAHTEPRNAGHAEEPARASRRADETGGAADHGVPESRPRIVERTSKSGTRVERETPEQRETRRIQHYADVFGSFLDSARQVDPAIDPETLRAEFTFRLEALEERRAGYGESGADPLNILRDIARYGGIAEKDDAKGYHGELARLKEGTKFGTLNGIRNVLRGKQALDEHGRPKSGLPIDVMLQRLRQDEGKYDYLETESDLLDAIDEAARFTPEADTFPGTDELRKAVGMDPAAAWWEKSWRPTTDMLADGDQLEATGDVDTSFNVDEFNQSLFDDLDVTPPDPIVDTLATGEQQPRLPGDVGDVRQAEKATPEFAAPFSLTPPEEKAGKPKKTEPAMSPEYAAALETHRAAGAAFREVTRKYRAREIGDEEYLAARKVDADATAAFEAAYDRELARSSRTTLFQSAPELTDEAVQQWVEDLKKKIGPDLATLDVRLLLTGDLQLNTMAVDRGAQRAGLGTKVMRELTRFADANGKRLVLTPAEKGFKGSTTSRGRLVDFYKRFGFVENKGRHKDFAIGDAMYREPTAPTRAADVTANPRFRAWFGDSKVVDDNGKPIVVYHGSARGDRIGDQFRKERATSGPMAFFTEDKAIADRYAVNKQDTSLEQPESYAEWFKFKVGAKRTTNLDDAWYQLTPEERQTVLDRLPTVGFEDHDQASGPIVANSQSIAGADHIAYEIRDARGNGLKAARSIWLDSGALYDREEEFGDVLKGLGLGGKFEYDDPHAARPKTFDVYLSIKNPLDTTALPQNVVDALIEASKGQPKPTSDRGADFWDKSIRDPEHWIGELLKDHAEGVNSFVWSSIPDWVTETIKGLGYDGIKDTGGKMGGSSHTVWVPFEPEQIKSASENKGTFNPKKRSILEQERRGAIRFGPGKQVDIALLERADLTTFIHELGHLGMHIMADFADQLGQRDPETLNPKQKQLLADFGTLLEHAGAESFGAMTTEQHETIARSFEAYAMEGKAPSVALEGTFARFRAWFVGVYKALKALNVQLTPAVRQVFDRMLASDQAIAEAEQRRGLTAMFTTPEEAGMTPEEFALYRQTVQDAHDKAVIEVDQKLLAEVHREQTRDWKEKREAMRARVEADVQQRPEYRALSAITKGTQPDGTPLVEGLETEPMQLSRKAIVERFGEERAKRLPRGVISSGEGIDPNTVAELFGYSSGDALLTAIEKAPAAADVIRAETNRRMLEEHGSLLLDGTLHDVARAAIENDTREKVIRAEMRALGRKRREVAPFVNAERAKGRDALAEAKAERDYERRWFDAEHKLELAIARGEKQADIDRLQKEVSELKAKARGGAVTIRAGIPSDDVLRQAAKERLASTPIGGIRPDVFWSAARRASKEATEKAARQDFDGAITAKQQELINTHLYREAQTALEDVADRVRFAQDLGSQASRARLYKAGPTYRDMVDSVLERFEFANVPPGTTKRRTAIADWVAGLEAQGLPVDLPPELLNEALRTNYKYLTLEEFRGVTDGLKEIVHIAQIKNRLLKIAQQKALDAVATEVGDAVRANTTRKAPTLERDRRASGERSRTIDGFFGSHRKLSFIAREMDGNVDGGPVWNALVRPLNDAGAREAEMNAAATKALGDIVEAAYPAGEKRRLFDKVEVPAVGDSLSKMERLMIALNWGNEGNRERIRRSEGWKDEQVQAVLDTLDARDLTFVQGVLDHINSYWPEIAAKQERVYGFAPEKVEATPIVTAAGTIAGGYFPLKYDDRLSARAAQNLDLEAGNLAKQAAYAQATTQRGHTKARVEGVKLPVRRDFGVIFQHLGQVIHDLSHHETLIDVGRVLAHPTVQKAIYETYGDQAYHEIKANVRDVAFGDIPARSEFERGLNHLRAGMSVAQLGWSLTTGMLHLTGAIPKSIVRIGAKDFGAGMMKFARDAVSMESTAAWTEEKSALMRTRGRTQQREINEIRNQVGVDTGKFSGFAADMVKGVTFGLADKQKMLDSYFYLLQKMQQIADVPTWAGQYQKSLNAGATELEAIAQADQAVLDAGGGGQTKDLARIQRGGPLAKLFTNFYSTFNVTYNLATNATRATNFKSPAAIGRLAVDYLLLYTVPATFGYAIHHAAQGGGFEDDAKTIAGHLIQANLAYLADTMIGPREFAGFIEGYTDYQGPAGLGFIPAIGNVIKQSEQEAKAIAEGKPTDALDEAFFKSLNAAGGILFHYPAAQINRTLAGFAALVEGKTKNPGVLFVGPPSTKQN